MPTGRLRATSGTSISAVGMAAWHPTAAIRFRWLPMGSPPSRISLAYGPGQAGYDTNSRNRPTAGYTYNLLLVCILARRSNAQLTAPSICRIGRSIAQKSVPTTAQ